MATASECYSALCNIRTIIIEQLKLLSFPVDDNDCAHMCITDLVNIYAKYTGCTYSVENIDTFIDSTIPSYEWLNKVIECDGCFVTCIEVEAGEYDWIRLDEEAILIEHTINSDGTYDAASFAADGFSKVVVDTSMQRNLQNKTVTPDDTVQAITADTGFNGLHTVTVKAVPTETKSVVPSDNPQEVRPSEGNYLSKVSVEAVINQTKSVTPTVEEQVVKPDAGYNGLIEVRVAGEPNLLPENILSGIDIFGVLGNASSQRSGYPITVSTPEAMDVRRSVASADTVGIVYKYTGETTDDYIKDTLYIIEQVDQVYAMKRISLALIKLSTPAIALDGDTLSWTAVPYATNYVVYANDTEVLGYTETTSFKIESEYPEAMSLSVVATASGYDSSFASNSLIWYPSNIKIVKHGNIQFNTNTYSNNLAVSFDNRAVFCCPGQENSTILSVNSNLTVDTFDGPHTNTLDTLSATNELLFISDADYIYSYTPDMIVTQTEAFMPGVVGRAAARVGSHIAYVGGIDTDTLESMHTGEAIDNELVVKSLAVIPYPIDENVLGSNNLNYAVFIGIGNNDEGYYYAAYDENLLQVIAQRICSDSVHEGQTAINFDSHAMFVGGRQFHNSDNGSYYSYYALFEAYDDNLVARLFSFGKFAHASGTALNGYALIGGGSTLVDGEVCGNTDILVYDNDLMPVSTDASVCLTHSSGAYVGAATTGNYAIFGGTSDFTFADVFTTDFAT